MYPLATKTKHGDELQLIYLTDYYGNVTTIWCSHLSCLSSCLCTLAISDLLLTLVVYEHTTWFVMHIILLSRHKLHAEYMRGHSNCESSKIIPPSLFACMTTSPKTVDAHTSVANTFCNWFHSPWWHPPTCWFHMQWLHIDTNKIKLQILITVFMHTIAVMLN